MARTIDTLPAVASGSAGKLSVTAPAAAADPYFR